MTLKPIEKSRLFKKAGRMVLPGLLFFAALAASRVLPAALSPARVSAAVCPGCSSKSVKIPAKVSQLAVVRYKGHSKGTFSFYQKNKEGKWIRSFSCKYWLGEKGIGKKKEGDKKTPVGFYYLEQPFGILKNPGMDKSWHYLKVTRRHYWCGTSTGRFGKYYNHLVTSRTRVPGEHLIDYKGSYDYSMFITYNKAGKKKKGSAIFLHCSKNRPTAGCVAISKSYMKKLMKKLKPGKKPGIVIYK